MDGNPIQVSAERKLEILQRLHLIGSMAEEYCNDKRVLASLVRTLKTEFKKLSRSKYPLLGDDIDKLNYLMTQLSGIVRRFHKAKKAEHYRIASTDLNGFFSNIEQEIVATAAHLAEKSELRKRIEEVVKRTGTLSEKFEPKNEGGSEPPKKALRDRDSE